MNKLFLLLVSVFLLLTGNVYATNITIQDGNAYSKIGWNDSYNNWWDRTIEDQEVEPGMRNTQDWDLEGFFTEGTSLSLVGGYNFVTGCEGYMSGDIFIDVNGDAVYGGSGNSNGDDENREVDNSYGYDYVLDLDWTDLTDLTYDVYAIGSDARVLTAWYPQNQGSSPWRYASGGTEIPNAGGTIGYFTGLTDDQTGFKGGSHNKLVVDLGFLLNGNNSVNFTAHYTMGCGNDNIMGQGTIPNPEPATLLLFGCGLIGIAGVCRKKF